MKRRDFGKVESKVVASDEVKNIKNLYWVSLGWNGLVEKWKSPQMPIKQIKWNDGIGGKSKFVLNGFLTLCW